MKAERSIEREIKFAASFATNTTKGNRDTLDATNIATIIALLASVLGFPAAAIPLEIIAAVMFILKIGFNLYCRGSTPPTKGDHLDE